MISILASILDVAATNPAISPRPSSSTAARSKCSLGRTPRACTSPPRSTAAAICSTRCPSMSTRSRRRSAKGAGTIRRAPPISSGRWWSARYGSSVKPSAPWQTRPTRACAPPTASPNWRAWRRRCVFICATSRRSFRIRGNSRPCFTFPACRRAPTSIGACFRGSRPSNPAPPRYARSCSSCCRPTPAASACF